MIRKLIMVPPALILMLAIALVIVTAEGGIASESHGNRIVASNAHCSARGITGDGLAATLALRCDTGGTIGTTEPSAIMAYTRDPATRFVCVVKQNATGECVAR